MELIIGLENIENTEDIIKIFFINIFTYYMNFKLINKKLEWNTKNTAIVISIMFLLSIMCRIIKNMLGFSYNIIFTVLILSSMFKLFNKQRFAYCLLLTIISLSINYIIFFISTFIVFLFVVITNITEVYIGLILILITYSLLIYMFYHIKRFKKGFIFLKRSMKNEYMDIVVLNIGITILFCTIVLATYSDVNISKRVCLIFILFAIIMFITIQKSLQLYYKQKLHERETNELKEELDTKNKEIEELEKENLRLSKINHSIAHKQKSLEYELNQMILKNGVKEENHIKDKIQSLSEKIQNETTSVELSKTNIDEIDKMLRYMQSECVKNEIDFELQINGNIHHMVNKFIAKEDLEILIADHIKNAIIAINHSQNINKNILVRLGLIDGFYSLYIYDSGIEFEIETLINLGVKPSTTHADDGGTGMGFMNTFDTLRKYNASMIIDEYGKPSKDNFTKVIKIIFDDKNEYKISSYREKEIHEKDINKRVS